MVKKEIDTKFSGMHSDEKVVFFFRHHFINTLLKLLRFILVWVPVLLVFFTFFIVGLRESTERKILLVLFSVGIFFIVHGGFLIILDGFLDAVIITNKRVIHLKKSIFLNELSDETKFENIQNITAEKKGFMRNLLKYGSITFYLYNKQNRIDFIHRPVRQFNRIARIREEYMLSKNLEESSAQS